MDRDIEDLDLKYLNSKLDRLAQRFRDFEEMVFNWKKEDSQDIDYIKNKLKISEKTTKEKKDG